MSFDLKLNQKKTNYISSFQKLTILTESYVHFLIMKKIKEKTVPNLCTDFGSEHVLFSHCVHMRLSGAVEGKTSKTADLPGFCKIERGSSSAPPC